MIEMLTIRQVVERCKAEGLPVSEYALRQWVRSGVIPARKIGRKALIYYPNVVRFVRCADGADNTPAAPAGNVGIRKLEVRL